MPLPLFTGEASLYKTRQSYRGYSGAEGRTTTAIVSLAQLPSNCGPVCYAGCGIKDVGCIVSNSDCFSLGFPGFVLCLLAKCGLETVQDIICAAQCPSCSACDTCTNCHSTLLGLCYCSGQLCLGTSCCDSGGGGGPPPPPMCCPPGHRCCGTCVPLAGGGSRCDDRCVAPPAVCP